MTLSAAHLRRILIATGTMLIILLVLWWGAWTVASARYREVIDGWISEGKASGAQIEYDDRQLFGFPRHVVFRFVNLHWKTADGIDFRAGNMDLSATPWEWQKFNARFKGHVEMSTQLDQGQGQDQHSLVLLGDGGAAHVELDKDGVWLQSRVTLMNAQLGLAPDYMMSAENLTASVERPETQPKDHTEAGLILSGEAKNAVLPEKMPTPFGQSLSQLTMAIRVMGAVPDVRRRDSVDAWNRESGVVEFGDLSMQWGPLVLASKGTMGFDDDLQPEGAFSGQVGNHEKVLQALMEHNFIPARQAGMLQSALSLFAKPSGSGDKKGIELPITVQLGGLFLGPVRIFTFPEIEWPNPPAVGTP